VKRHRTTETTSLRLIRMQPEDLDTVLAIEYQSFSTPWTADMFRTEMQNTERSCMLVARVGPAEGTVVGYIGYRMVVDEMHILIVAVDPQWRRHGIARRLLCQAMEQARRAACTRATLEVRVSNTAAQQLYYQLKFAPVGVRPRYYSRPPEDALILWRDPL
jgi:[ribosomal protein S18]-alanine N-acetyltransferase